MNTHRLLLSVLVLLSWLVPGHRALADLETSITYQGQLNSGGSPAGGVYDFTFQVFTNASGGVAPNPPVTATAIAVSNGLFTAVVDFGGRPDDHRDSWIELAVRTNGAADYTVLSPRQPLTSTPFAWFADNAANAVSAASVIDGGIGPAALGTGSVTAAAIAPGAVWALDSPDGSIAGVLQATDDGAVKMAGCSVSTSGLLALGHGANASGNAATALGWDTIASGDTATALGFDSEASGEYSTAMGNSTKAIGNHSTAAGSGSEARGTFSVAMGFAPIAEGESAIAMGNSTAANADYSVAFGTTTTADGLAAVAMGYCSAASGYAATAFGNATVASGTNSTSMGLETQATNECATALGSASVAGGRFSMAAGHQALALHDGSFVWSDGSGSIASSGDNQFIVRATGGVGINTSYPSGFALNVAGDTRVSGALRLGSETNTLSGPNYPAGSPGLVIRRISSVYVTAGTLVARTDRMQLQRDGTYAGLQLAYTNASNESITCTGVTVAGALVVYRNYLRTGAGTLALFTDAQRVVHYDISFGSVYNNGHTCHVILDRFDDGTGSSDYYLVGTVTTTYNQ